MAGGTNGPVISQVMTQVLPTNSMSDNQGITQNVRRYNETDEIDIHEVTGHVESVMKPKQ